MFSIHKMHAPWCNRNDFCMLLMWAWTSQFSLQVLTSRRDKKRWKTHINVRVQAHRPTPSETDWRVSKKRETGLNTIFTQALWQNGGVSPRVTLFYEVGVGSLLCMKHLGNFMTSQVEFNTHKMQHLPCLLADKTQISWEGEDFWLMGKEKMYRMAASISAHLNFSSHLPIQCTSFWHAFYEYL